MPGLGFSLQQTQCVLDCVDQRPVEFEQLPPCATGEDELGQRSAGSRSALGQLAAKVGEGDRFVALNLGEASLQGSEGVGVGENLGGLLQCLILVDWNQSCSRNAIAGHQNVIAPIADIIEQAAEVAT